MTALTGIAAEPSPDNGNKTEADHKQEYS